MRQGLGVAEARAMHPDIEIVEIDSAGDRRLLEALADWCDRYTPLVAIEGDEGLFLDITGCSHLFGGEPLLLEDVLARLQRQGFDARAAIASTPGAAWGAARHASGMIIEAGCEADFLAPLPLTALRLESTIRHGLESVGLRVAGAIMSAPRAPLVRRFGKAVVLRLDQALGRVEEAISPRLAVPALSVERHFAEPIALLDDIEALIVMLSRQLKVDLERRGEGAEKLQLQLFHTDGRVNRIAIAASRPLRDPKLIQRLFHEKLAAATTTLDPGYGFDLVRLAVMSAAHFDDTQASLGEAEHDHDGDLALFADRVRARLGERAVTTPHMVESYLPERAAPLLPFELGQSSRTLSHVAAAASMEAATLPRLDRPIRVFTSAERVEVTAAEIPEGPPGRFRWRSVSYRIVSSEGPERILPEWWQTLEAIEARDYFRVEDEAGRRYWLYREGRYGMERAPRWYMQGIFA